MTFNINFKDGKKMILIHPHPEEVKQRFPDHQCDIIVIKKYFGKDGDQEAICKNIRTKIMI
jgi:hypothetical protein